MHDDTPHDEPKKRRRPAVRAVLAILALAGVCVLLAACGSSSNTPTVAGSGPSTKASSSSKHSGGSALAYAQCMRSHGVSNFPDPNAEGGFSAPAGMDPNSPTYKAAAAACASKAGSGPNFSPAKRAAISADNLKYATCMRSHGISNFPDPDSQGMLSIGSNSRNSNSLDPSSPQYQAANKACQHDLYHGGGNGG
jgi:hypothetical protein